MGIGTQLGSNVTGTFCDGHLLQVWAGLRLKIQNITVTFSLGVAENNLNRALP